MLGLINTLIRPLLVLLTLPVTILTLGLFIFVINGLLFWAVGSFVRGFHVGGFWAGVFGAIVYSLISWALSALLLPKQRKRPSRDERQHDQLYSFEFFPPKTPEGIEKLRAARRAARAARSRRSAR